MVWAWGRDGSEMTEVEGGVGGKKMRELYINNKQRMVWRMRRKKENKKRFQQLETKLKRRKRKEDKWSTKIH
jgi:hypothetical protein